MEWPQLVITGTASGREGSNDRTWTAARAEMRKAMERDREKVASYRTSGEELMVVMLKLRVAGGGADEEGRDTSDAEMIMLIGEKRW